ncbi:MAG TPA: CDP-diacylglycerol--serine O-phosphatidyltransferase [Synergistales bacterium]|nr:CDP-diacylglycerol--serine O-phosphatidyltransferase [Synergistales bacterium]
MKTKRIRRSPRAIPFRKIIPNMITSGNILSGILSMILTLQGHYHPAAWLIMAAVFFDAMDGKMARSLGGSTEFGVELDSLADAVSFGAAPALLFYAVFLWGWLGIVGALSAAFFGLCGALRLARFNVFHAPGPFQGLPIPAGGLFLASLVMGGLSVPPAMAAALAVATGLLMVSSIPYGNLKRLRSGNVNRLKLAFLFALTVALIVTLQGKAPLAALCIYIFSGFFRFDWRKWLAIDPAELEEEEIEAEA